MQQWLDILGIDKRTADAPFHSRRGQQRLALSSALVKHPTLLILDEPLQGWTLNRQLVRRFVDVLIGEGHTAAVCLAPCGRCPDCITHRGVRSQWRRLHLSTRPVA